MFGSLITAMITPFDQSGALDCAEAQRVARHLAATGSDALVLSGTTGESPTLTHAEEADLYRAVLDAVDIPVIAGTGSNCTQTAIAATQAAEALGVHASLQVTPYYNRPSQAGLIAHFTAIADATQLPIILYNIPGRTSVNMTPETIATLAKHPRIVGVKEAGGCVDMVRNIRALTPESFIIYAGDDGLIVPFMDAGAIGVVSVASHIVGPQLKQLIKHHQAGETAASQTIADALMPLCDALFMTTNPVPVKAAMNQLGFSVGNPRLPLVPLTANELDALQKALAPYV
jgi:4-hydroxy-tetrahydrodipicolinate synthase